MPDSPVTSSNKGGRPEISSAGLPAGAVTGTGRLSQAATPRRRPANKGPSNQGLFALVIIAYPWTSQSKTLLRQGLERIAEVRRRLVAFGRVAFDRLDQQLGDGWVKVGLEIARVAPGRVHVA